jgi:hypothetical protein
MIGAPGQAGKRISSFYRDIERPAWDATVR